MQAAQLHFVRCIKPNDVKAAAQWDKPVVTRQIQSSGIVHAVQASRSGFTDHLLPGQIVAQFGCLVGAAARPSADGFDGVWQSTFSGAEQLTAPIRHWWHLEHTCIPYT